MSKNKQAITKIQQITFVYLCVFLDEDGIIRVDGKLRNASVHFQKRYSVLPPKHPFTEIIIRNEHIRLLHVGYQQTIASLREHYSLQKSSVRNIIQKCIKCFKARTLECVIGQLPMARVTG